MLWRPHLRTVLLLVNVIILFLPLGGIAILRLYESELIRATESELCAQGAMVCAAFRDEMANVMAGPCAGAFSTDGSQSYIRPVNSKWVDLGDPSAPLHPLPPRLDIASDSIRPPAPEAEPSASPPDSCASAAAARIRPLLVAASKVTLAGIRVTDYQGVVVASTRGDLGMSIFAQEEVSRALNGEMVSIMRERVLDQPIPPLESISRRGRVRVFVALPVMFNDRVIGAVVLSRTALDILKALYLNRTYLLWGGVVLIGAVVLVSVLTALTISRPVSALIRQAEQVAQGEQKASVPLTRPGTFEIDRLSKALVAMSVKLEQRGEYIRTFASSVSHEFKTPLTAMRGAVELLKDHLDEMTQAERSRFLQILEEDTDRLDRMVRRLLELARADVLRPARQGANARDVLETVIERFRLAGLPVTAQVGRGVDKVCMPAEVFEAVVSNLLDNVRQHGGEEVRADVRADVASLEGREFLQLVFIDTGPGISSADALRVFTPFFTTARGHGGTGLGLSIVKSLVTAHNGEISIETDGPGARFRVRIPTVCRQDTADAAC